MPASCRVSSPTPSPSGLRLGATVHVFSRGSWVCVSKVLGASVFEEQEHGFEEDARSCSHFTSGEDEIAAAECPRACDGKHGFLWVKWIRGADAMRHHALTEALHVEALQVKATAFAQAQECARRFRTATTLLQSFLYFLIV